MLFAAERCCCILNCDRFAVIGHPIGHTMSPFIHKRLFSLSGLSAEYGVLDIAELSNGIDALRKLDGFNITIPHKVNIIPYLDEIDDNVFGSVNTVRCANGKMKGFTTDGAGCLKALHNHGAGFNGHILLLGNGGAARAVAFEALNAFKSLTLAVRRRERGLELAADLLAHKPEAEIEVVTFEDEEKSLKKYDLLMNTTSVGMFPNAGRSPVGESVVSRCESVFDAVYNPRETKLLQAASKLQKNVIGGMEMLVFQAVKAHEYWYGAEFSGFDVMKLCEDAQEKMNRLFAE